MIKIRDNEQVLGTYRRHKFILLLEALPIALFAVLTPFAALYAGALVSVEFAAAVPIIYLLAAILFHVLWLAFFIILADFYLDVWVLTSERMIAVEQKGLFARTISEFELPKVQDVTTHVHGMLATLLDYGDLNVRTASEHEHFVLRQVWNPGKAKDEISRARFQCEDRVNKNYQHHGTPSF